MPTAVFTASVPAVPAGAEGSQNWEAHLNDQDVGKPHGQLDCLAAGQQLVARQLVGPLQHIIRHLLQRQQVVHHFALQEGLVVTIL